VGTEETAARLLAELRERRPVVHHLANFVTMSDVAAVTRALGAMPIMAMAPEEVQEVASSADAMVVSLGTPTTERLDAIERALAVARRRGIPVAVDPVGAGASKWRTEAARRIIRAVPRPVIRANPAEAAALAGKQARLRGVEAAESYDHDEVIEIAKLVVQSSCVAVITGPRDVITDSRRGFVVDNGHPWLAAMPGAGCMVTAVVGSFLGVADRADFVITAAAGLACFGLAAEKAASKASGPGSLKPQVIDALFAMTPDELQAGMKYSELAAPRKTHAPRSQRIRHHR